MSRPRAVLFDFYGTLAHAVVWGPTVAEVLAGWDVQLDPHALQLWQAESADGVDHAEHSVDRATYVAWERARLRRLIHGCGAGDDVVDRIVEELYTAMKTFTLEAYPEVPAVLAALRGRGTTVAVCSNWDWALDAALAQSGLDKLVDVAVTSAQAGSRKPHPHIYRHTLERCGGVAPADALFVGDTWGPDVEGPARVGIRPVHLRREGCVPAGGTPEVACVPDLRGILELAA